MLFFFIVIAKSTLTWPVLTSTIELTSKCSKRWSENTRLRLVVPLEFWTFLCDFYGRYEYRSWKIVVELLTLGRTRIFHTPTVVRGGGGGRWWNSSPEFLICCSISKRFCLRWKASDLLNKIRYIYGWWRCWRPLTLPTMVAILDFPRIRNQVTIEINGNLLCLICKITHK